MSFFTTPLLFLLLFFVLFSTIFIVRQQTAVIIERFGKFQSVRGPGFQLKIPLVDRIAGKLSLKVLQLDVVVEQKPAMMFLLNLRFQFNIGLLNQKYLTPFISLTFRKIKLLPMFLI